MSRTSLTVHYRRGRPFAAYLQLDPRGDRSARVEVVSPTVNVDYAADGRPGPAGRAVALSPRGGRDTR